MTSASQVRSIGFRRFVSPEIVLVQFLDEIPRAGAPAVASGASYVVPCHEPAKVVHVGLEQMGRVGYQACSVTVFQQNLGDGGVLVRNFVPAVVAVNVRKAAHAGETAVAYLDRLAGFGKTAIESRRFYGERVKRRGGDMAKTFVWSHDVGPKCVEANDNDVRMFHSCKIPFGALCLFDMKYVVSCRVRTAHQPL